MFEETVGVILAGGQSRRMGTDKAFLEIEGIPLITRIIDTLLPIFPTVAIVSKDIQKFSSIQGAQLIQDLFQEQHALGGIYTALSAFPGKDCFVFACDLPFLNASLIHSMMEEKNGYDLFIPKSRHGLEPLHAIYTEKCLKAMKKQIRRKRWSLGFLVSQLRSGIYDLSSLRAFDPEERCLMNVNTPHDLRMAEKNRDA